MEADSIKRCWRGRTSMSEAVEIEPLEPRTLFAGAVVTGSVIRVSFPQELRGETEAAHRDEIPSEDRVAKAIRAPRFEPQDADVEDDQVLVVILPEIVRAAPGGSTAQDRLPVAAPAIEKGTDGATGAEAAATAPPQRAAVGAAGVDNAGSLREGARHAVSAAREEMVAVVATGAAGVIKLVASAESIHSAVLSGMASLFSVTNLMPSGAQAIASSGKPRQAPANAGSTGPGDAAPKTDVRVDRESALSPARIYRFARMGNPLSLLNDPLALFADESIRASALRQRNLRWAAWSITATVVMIDVAMLAYYGIRRRPRQ
jgi:hypothetical protein